MKPTNSIWLRLFAALFALSLVAAACGDDDTAEQPSTGTAEAPAEPAGEVDDPEPADEAPAEPAGEVDDPEPADEAPAEPAEPAVGEVTVGVLVPLTGELGEFGKIVADAIEFGVGEINAAGGTRCGTIRTVVADTGGDAETGIREATNMIESEGAVAILGPTSGVMVPLVDLAHREEVVIMSPYAGTITLNELGGDFVYRTVVLRPRRRGGVGPVAVEPRLRVGGLPDPERGVDHLPGPRSPGTRWTDRGSRSPTSSSTTRASRRIRPS